MKFKDDKQRHYITAEGKDIGTSTTQRMTIVVTQKDNNSQVKIASEWKAGTVATITAIAASGIPFTTDWMTTKWEIDRLGVAFAECVKIASQIKNGNISYE